MLLQKLHKFKNADNLESIQKEAVKMIKILENWLCYYAKKESE